MKLGMPILYEFDKISDNIKLAKKLKLDFIEFNLNFGYFQNELANKETLKAFKESSLEATCHFYDEADFGSYDEITSGYIKLLKKYLKYLKKYNVKLINVHLNIGPIVTISGNKNYIYEKEYDSYIKRLTKNLKKVQKLVSKIDAKLVLENVTCPNFIINTYKDLKDEFYFNYDIGHDDNDNYHLYEIKDLLTFLEFHIHDGNSKTCHLEIGKGNIDIKKFKDFAKEAYVVLEVKSSKDLISSVDKFRAL